MRFEDTVIWTCDHDLLQCVTSKVSVLMFSSAKKQTLDGGQRGSSKHGTAHQSRSHLVKALSGDASDNIKGVKGIGKKDRSQDSCKNADWALNKVAEHKKIKEHMSSRFKRTSAWCSFSLVHELRLTSLSTTLLTWSRSQASDYIDWLEKYEFYAASKACWTRLLKS